MTTIGRIISGGQTGVDQAALRAAKKLGIPTGGWMPKGYRTEDGPRPEFAELYGMQEHTSYSYGPRTTDNIMACHVTLLLGNSLSAGSRLTIKICENLRRPYSAISNDLDFERAALVIRGWLASYAHVPVFNVAGNRESVSPGIGAWAEAVLLEALKS